jgi:hypothetical protein
MDVLMQAPAALCTTKAGLAVGTTTTLTTANTQIFSIKGKAFSVAAAANEATPTTDAVTGAAFVAVGVSKASVFLVGRNAAGAMKAAQGQIVDLNGIAGSNALKFDVPQFPAMPDDFTPYGYIIVKVGTTGAAWTFGTSNFAGPPTGVVFTIVDVMTMPDRPQAS